LRGGAHEWDARWRAAIADNTRAAPPVSAEHRVERGGVGLHVDERGHGEPAVLLVHGIACDRRYMEPVAVHLAARHRTVAVDLRGHGRSDAPDGPYDVATHVDDLVEVCAALGVERPVVVGHSLGGVLTVVLAAIRPALPRAVAVLDAPIVPPPARAADMRAHFARLRDGEYGPEMRRYFSAFFAPGDGRALEDWVMTAILEPPPHAVIATWEHASFDHDTAACLEALDVPLLYIDAGTPNAMLDRLVALCPHAFVGRTVGAGHFLQMVVPDQVNAMLDRFLALTANDGAPPR
jgi:pimeloyl-ACP methyl ester carboxylesterase